MRSQANNSVTLDFPSKTPLSNKIPASSASHCAGESKGWIYPLSPFRVGALCAPSEASSRRATEVQGALGVGRWMLSLDLDLIARDTT